VLTYFGFMHGEAVGIGGGFGVTPAVALAYAVVAGGLFALGRFGTSEHYASHPDMPLAAPAE
jgi:adenine/guanine/hypoxanthine permease